MTLQLRHHDVKSPAQDRDFVIARPNLHPGRKIAVADFLRAADFCPANCEVVVDYAPVISIENMRGAKLLVCPSTEATASHSRDGVDVRDVEIQIAFLKQARPSDVPKLLMESANISRGLEYSKTIGIANVTPGAADRVLLYDPAMLREKGMFFSVITYALEVTE